VAVLFLAGCSSHKGPAQLNKDEEALVQVGLAYRDASNALKRGPESIKELKTYLKKYGDPDALLVSPRDGQPYQIVWGLLPLRPTKTAQMKRFLAYEKSGKDGKRYALDFMMKVYLLSEEEFTQMQRPN
jgi:hypothetical protein